MVQPTDGGLPSKRCVIAGCWTRTELELDIATCPGGEGVPLGQLGRVTGAAHLVDERHGQRLEDRLHGRKSALVAGDLQEVLVALSRITRRRGR